MAKSRMISTAVVRSSKFQRMSAGAQALYLQFVADADDMGVAEGEQIFAQCSKIRRPALKELLDSGFVTILDESDAIVYINDFHTVNSFAKHGANPSIYMDLLLSNCCTQKLINKVKIKASGNPMLDDAMSISGEALLCNADRFRQVASNNKHIGDYPMLFDSLLNWYQYTDERGFTGITDKSIEVLIEACAKRCQEVDAYSVCDYIDNAVASGYLSVNWTWFDNRC